MLVRAGEVQFWFGYLASIFSSSFLASIVEEFVDSPSVDLLDQCSKDQFLLIAKKYDLKEDMKH